jgi:SAM-dependent methyltransferase
MAIEPIDYYDAEKWGIDEDRVILQREIKAIKWIKANSDGSPIKILDVGCGNGQFLAELDDKLGKRTQMYGVDYSEYKLKSAQAYPYEFRHCNLEVGIPYEDATFDIVYSGEVIEHIYNPDFMLEECYRVLKPGGLIVVSTPNLQAWYNRVLFLFGIQPLFYEVSTKSSHIGAGPLRRFKKQTAPVGHIRVFNRRSIVDLVENEGFDVISVEGAIFQSLPGFAQIIDNCFNIRPSLASNLIVMARKQ